MNSPAISGALAAVSSECTVGEYGCTREDFTTPCVLVVEKTVMHVIYFSCTSGFGNS